MKRLKFVPMWAWIWGLKAVGVGIIFVVIYMLFSISGKTQQIAEQAIEIAKQNQEIAEDNQAHIDCIAELFARYTRDSRPITIDDLNTCQSSQGDTPTTEPSSTTPSANNNPAPARTNSSNAPQAVPPPTGNGTTPEPSVIERIISIPGDILDWMLVSP